LPGEKQHFDKYAGQAEHWSDDAYADADAYLAHRAELIVSLGPALVAGDTVLDLACGDAGLAAHLPGLRYIGIDASPQMVDAARRRGREVVLADLNDYEPAQPVTATTCFRAIYYAGDRPTFFRRVADYTERKLVFDLNPRQYRIGEVKAELREAGFDGFVLRPFFAPQRVSLPGPAAAALRGLERTGPLARLLLTFRFSYLCAAFRGGKYA
jgi:SAM-dependent methyltransferase